MIPGAWRVFWDISAHEFKPVERRLLLVIWAKTMANGQTSASFPSLFFSLSGIRNREARKTLEGLSSYGVISLDWSSNVFGILPQSANRRWSVRRLCGGEPSGMASGTKQPELIDEPRLDQVLTDVAHESAARESRQANVVEGRIDSADTVSHGEDGSPGECSQALTDAAPKSAALDAGWTNVRKAIEGRIDSADTVSQGEDGSQGECNRTQADVITPQGECNYTQADVITPQGECNYTQADVITRQSECNYTQPADAVRTGTRAREALAKARKIDKSSELKLKLSSEAPKLEHWEHVLARVRQLVRGREWIRHGRQWIRAVQQEPDYIERLVGDCEQQGSYVKNPGAWMFQVAKKEGYWPKPEEEVQT